MKAFRPALVLASLSLSLAAACSAKDAASTDSTAGTAAGAAPASTSSRGGDDLADVTNYRLTMAAFDKYYAAQRNVALRMKALPEAERQRLKDQADAEHVPDNESIDELGKRLAAEPLRKAAIEEAGLSPREFALLTMSMMQTGMAEAVLAMRPKDNQDSLMREMHVNPDNIRFYREHKAELEQKQKAMEAEMKRLGASNDG